MMHWSFATLGPGNRGILIFLSAKPEYVPCTVGRRGGGGGVRFSGKVHANIPQKARILFSLK